MTHRDQTADELGLMAVDRTRVGRNGGSISLVLLVALALVVAGGGLLFVGRANAESYLLALLALLAMAGVFLLLALAAGILRVSGRESVSPLIKSLVDHAPDGLLVTDAGGRIVYANAAYLQLIGAANAQREVRPIERVFIGDPGVSEAVYRLLRAAREGRRLEEECTGRKPRRRGRALAAHAGPPAGRGTARGRTDRLVGCGCDAGVRAPGKRVPGVAERHRLSRSCAGRLLLESIPAAATVNYLNATLAEWLDYDLAQVGSGGLKLEQLVAGQGAALLTMLSASPGEVKTEILDLDLKTRGGRTLPVRLHHKVAFGGNGMPGASRTLVLNRESGEGEDPQRLAEVRFMRFFHNTPMAIATVDKPGRIVRSNALFARLFRPVLTSEAPGGCSILAVVAERDRAALESAIRKAADKQGEIAPVDAALAGTGERFARFYVTAVEEEAGDREAAIVYGIETTEQRTLESQFTQSQKMELVGKLAGGIAHDFNNVLGAIMMATDFLVNAHKPTDPSFQDIMQIRQNANRAASLVRHLLAFSRKQTLRPQVLDLGEAVSDLTMLLRRLIGENVQLNVVHGRDLWPVKVDVAQFEQVIVNLAVNARDAMPDGGKLTLRTANVGTEESARLRQLQGHADPASMSMLIEVTDDGSGMPPEIVDKIFDPFFTTKEVNKGTGLGLSTVYGIVKQTGGFIYVDTEVGKGTAFRIFLPRYVPGVDDEPAPPALPEHAAPRARHHRGR